MQPPKALKNGRTNEDHEMVHYKNKQRAVDLIDKMLHKMADEKCVSRKCCAAKKECFKSWHKAVMAITQIKDNDLDIADYQKPNEKKEERKESIENFLRLNSDKDKMKEQMNNACSKQ